MLCALFSVIVAFSLLLWYLFHDLLLSYLLFTYIGVSKRSWKSWWAEHKPGVRPEIKSAIKDHTQSTGHDASMENGAIIEGRVHGARERLFLESLHSVMDSAGHHI